jgi:hypothetical protein
MQPWQLESNRKNKSFKKHRSYTFREILDTHDRNLSKKVFTFRPDSNVQFDIDWKNKFMQLKHIRFNRRGKTMIFLKIEDVSDAVLFQKFQVY